MKEQIKIAIFGLSLNVLENFKYKLTQMCEGLFHISWVNIGDPQLEILLVNDMFFSSPTIQNLVSAKQVPYLRLITQEELSGSIVDDTLYLPFNENDQILHWFKQRYAKIPLKYQPQHQVMPKKLDISKILNELLNERNGNLQVFDRNGPIGLVNTRSEQIWLDPSRKIQGTDDTLNYTYATMQMTQNVSLTQGIDLRSWMWNMMWYSNRLIQENKTQKYYKLQYWPQSNSVRERAKIFKIAACFEQGSNIWHVQKKLEIPIETIEKFVSVGLITHMLKEIKQEDARFLFEQPEQKQSVIKGFFGKLRKKLGI